MASTRSQHTTTESDAVDAAVDYYALLGVPVTASPAEIRRAYRTAVKRTHPDRHHPVRRAAAEERTKLLNHAYATLSRPDRRRRYDQTIKRAMVQDQLMSRYVGGLGGPGTADPFGAELRRERTSAERRDRVRNDRNAMVSILVVFGGITLAVVAALVLWAAVSAAVQAVF